MSLNPWPGERLALDDVIVTAGSPDVWGAVANDPGTGTLAAGDEFYVYTDQARLLLEGDLIGECNWIIEAASGSAQLAVSQGYDLGWTYSGAFVWTAEQTLGVSAASRMVLALPAEWRTFHYLASVEGALLLRVRVLTGSLTVDSLHLQVEPPGGLKVQGGTAWSGWLTPDLVTRNAPQVHAQVEAEASISWEATNPPLETKIAKAREAYEAAIAGLGTVTQYIGAGGATRAHAGSFFGTMSWGSTGIARVGYKSALWTEDPDLRQLPPAFDVTYVYGRDYVYTKDGSPADYTWRVEFADGATDAVGWRETVVTVGMGVDSIDPESVSWTLGKSATSSPLGYVEGETVGSWPPPLLPPVGSGGASGPSGSYAVDLDVPAPPGSDWTLSIHDGYSAGEVVVDTITLNDLIYMDITAEINYRMPDYRVLMPVFVPDPGAVGRTPRFFVKDHEEVWRPVGFGKPASDLSLFHVWTPVGWYVECRDGETYTNAHPLKVKLYDGSWDTVAHMRPV